MMTGSTQGKRAVLRPTRGRTPVIDGRSIRAAAIAIGAVFLSAAGGAVAPHWERLFGGAGADVATAIAPAAKDGFIVAGHVEPKAGQKSNGYAALLDRDGGVVWSKTFGGRQADLIAAVVAAPDGGLVVAGSTRSRGRGRSDGWVVKFDATGKLLWQRTFGGSARDAFEALTPATGGGYLLAGYTRSSAKGGQDGWVVKITEAGSPVWRRKYGGQGEETIKAILAAPGGGYLLAGQQADRGAKAGDGWAVRTDNAGKKTWEKRFPGKNDDLFNAAATAPEGGFVVAGQTLSRGAGGSDAWLVRLDADGTLAWERTFGGAGADTAHAVSPGPDGGFVLAGVYDSGEDASGDAWVLRTDPNGKELAAHKFGGIQADSGNALAMAPEGRFALAGTTASKGVGGTDGWVLAAPLPVASAPTPAPTLSENVFDNLPGHNWFWIAGGGVLFVVLAGLIGRAIARRQRDEPCAPTKSIGASAGVSLVSPPLPPATAVDPVDTPGEGKPGWLFLGWDEGERPTRFQFGPLDLAHAGDGLILGRNPKLCHLVVTNDSVSRRHLRFSLRDGTIMVEDLDSTNGSYLNDEPLAPNQPTPLHDGASLILGEYFIRFIGKA